MLRFLRRENLVKQSQQSISLPAINSPQKEDAGQRSGSGSNSDSDGEIAEVSRKQRMFARKSIRRDRKKQKEHQKKIEHNIISMDDFLSKQAEFKMWLREEKNKTANDLKSPKLKSYFKDFMKLWNKRKLPQKYYRGSTGTDTPPPSRNQKFALFDRSPFPDVSGLPTPVDLSLEGSVLLDSPFSTFGKSPGDPLTPNDTPRIIKLPDIDDPGHADKENTTANKCKEKKSDSGKKKKGKSTTPKKSKLKNNPYKITVLSWTSKGELNVRPASAEKSGKKPQSLNDSIPYQEVKDATCADAFEFDPLYADPDPLLNATSVSRSKSLDSGLMLDSFRPVSSDVCKSVEDIYAVPVKKKRMSLEKCKNVAEAKIDSPPPPLPPKRKSPQESWPYQTVAMDSQGAAPILALKGDTNIVCSPKASKAESIGQGILSPMRMAISMPDICNSNNSDLEEDSSSTSSSSSSEESEAEDAPEKLKVKIEDMDPEVLEFLNADLSPPPPPPDPTSEPYPLVRLSLLPPPPPELLMDTPPDASTSPSEAYSSISSLVVEKGTPRSSKILDEEMLAFYGLGPNSLNCKTPQHLLPPNSSNTDTPPPMLVPISPAPVKQMETLCTKKEMAAPAKVTQLINESKESRRVSIGPVLKPPSLKTSEVPTKDEQDEAIENANSEKSSSSTTPNHDYLEDGLTDMDSSMEKDEVFCYRQALSGAMKLLSKNYDSAPEATQNHLCTEDIIDQRSTPKHDARNRHHSENSATVLQKSILLKKGERAAETSVKRKPVKPPAIRPKPSKVKVIEALEKARQKHSSSSSVSSTSSDSRSSVNSEPSANEHKKTATVFQTQCKDSKGDKGQYSSSPSQHLEKKVLGPVSQNSAGSPSKPSPKKPPRTFLSNKSQSSPLVPKEIKLKGILKTPPRAAILGSIGSQSPNRKVSSCAKSLIGNTGSKHSFSTSSDVYETDIDSVIDDTENRNPNECSQSLRETDLDKILAEMTSYNPLSPLVSQSEMNL